MWLHVIGIPHLILYLYGLILFVNYIFLEKKYVNLVDRKKSIY